MGKAEVLVRARMDRRRTEIKCKIQDLLKALEELDFPGAQLITCKVAAPKSSAHTFVDYRQGKEFACWFAPTGVGRFDVDEIAVDATICCFLLSTGDIAFGQCGHSIYSPKAGLTSLLMVDADEKPLVINVDDMATTRLDDVDVALEAIGALVDIWRNQRSKSEAP